MITYPFVNPAASCSCSWTQHKVWAAVRLFGLSETRLLNSGWVAIGGGGGALNVVDPHQIRPTHVLFALQQREMYPLIKRPPIYLSTEYLLFSVLFHSAMLYISEAVI